MTLYSDAAKEYASSRWHDGTIGWFEAAGDFDAGAAYDAPPLKAWERELLGADPEPVRCCDLVGEPFDHVIDSGWLCEVHTHHTCGSTQPHEPGCGLVPLVNLTELEGWPEPFPVPVLLTERIGAGHVRVGDVLDVIHRVTVTAVDDECNVSTDDAQSSHNLHAYNVSAYLVSRPDPDMDLAASLPIDLATGWDIGAWLDVLAKVRSVGYEITKVAER